VPAAASALAAALCLALAAGCGSDDPVPERPDFVGLVSEDVFGGDGDYRAEMVEKQAKLGVGLTRQTFDWSKIETERGKFDFSGYDGWIEALAKQHMRVLPILFNPPAFYSARPAQGAKRGTYPPRSPGDIAGFARALAERYGPDGSFWDDHDVPKTPIRSWQIWNEPNVPVYWPSGPDAREYVGLLRAAADALRDVDPKAEVVTGGLPNSKRGVPTEAYLADMLEAGAGDVADTFAIHPYATDASAAIDAVRRMRATLRENGVDKPIWITEIGWATQGPRSDFTVGMRGQAAQITHLLADVARLRERLGIRGLVYYNWRDSEPFQGGFDFFGLHTGLLTLNAVEKPGYVAFERGVEKLAR
jgi:hypothetical protein